MILGLSKQHFTQTELIHAKFKDVDNVGYQLCPQTLIQLNMYASYLLHTR